MKKNNLETAEKLFMRACKLQESKRFKAAFALLSKAAELGDAGAQNNIGYAYATGQGVKKDSGKAITWYKRAWKNGYGTGSLHNIGLEYRDRGNWQRALHWLNRARKLGDGDSALEMALIVSNLSGSSVTSKKKVKHLLQEVIRSKSVVPDSVDQAKKILKELNRPSPTQNKRSRR